MTWINKKYFYLCFFVVLIFLSLILDFGKKVKPSSSKDNIITVLTLIRFIDSKFENVLPYIEPGAMDHYSYTPLRINDIRDKVKELYGYDIINKKLYYNLNNCRLKYKQKGKINLCIAEKYWLKLSKEEWSYILDKYNIKNIISPFEIENLYLCNSYKVQKDDRFISLKPKDNIYHYKKSKYTTCEKLIQHDY